MKSIEEDGTHITIKSVMRTSPDLIHDFSEIKLEFIDTLCQDVFSWKNNKTVAETLRHHPYRTLAAKVEKCYQNILDEPLGTALLHLKQDGDPFYRRFLNPYGDLQYSTFRIATPKFESKTGVYAYFEDKILRYIGRCKNSMKKRVNQGHGKIYPKNCYLDGQRTDCRLNAKITEISESIMLRLWVIENKSEIERVEASMIREYEPAWNIQRAS